MTQSGADDLDNPKSIMTFLTIFTFSRILCSFMLVEEYKADREIPDEDETSQKRFQQTNVSYEMETFPGKR